MAAGWAMPPHMTANPYATGWPRVALPEYLARVRRLLPNWPDEVLESWFYDNSGDILEPYGFLDFSRFEFRRESWPLERLLGIEATLDTWLWQHQREGTSPCELFDFHHAGSGMANVRNWLTHYMVEHGTWSTPIVLLDNLGGVYRFPHGEPLKSPVHLLEGHRRITYLDCLRQRGLAAPTHDVWLVTINSA